MRWILALLIAATVKSVACVDVWWESAVVYQIYPRSFKDSNGDGIGDLNGITSKLGFLKDTGVDAIWLSPIYKSPMNDFGYDITDYKSIADEYGTMDDFDALMAEAKRIGLRVVLDYVPNHTSLESEWFKNSVLRIGEYENYYIWADGKVDPDNPSNTLPPSNWLSAFRKSAWELNTDRGQYYLHQFVTGQPDINYRNAALRDEMKNVLRFWLDKHVSGFRVDAVNFLFEADPAAHGGIYPDEPRSYTEGKGPEDYEYLSHVYTRDQNETFDVVYDWRAVLDEYTELHQEKKIMMTEAYTEISQMMRYYGDGTRDGSMPFNFVFLGEMTSTSTAPQMKTVVDKWINNMPRGKIANWVNGNHDQSRMATRYGVNRVDAMNMLSLILPGVTITYQGEELGMTNGDISWADTKDPQACNTEDPINYWKSSRDPARTPYHWDTTTSAGFSTTTSTWLPVADNYETVNLASQMAASKSHYKFYKDVVALKQTPAVKSGEVSTTALNDNILVVTRIPAGEDSTVVGIINLSDQSSDVSLTSIPGVPQNLEVVASGVACVTEKGTQVLKDKVTVSGSCAIALRSVAQPSPAPGTETAAPGTVTAAPGTVTAAPGTGTAAPGTVTAAPGTGTAAPGTVTAAPGTVTAAPGTVTAAPGTGTAAPGTVTAAPGTVTAAPGTVTAAPDTSNGTADRFLASFTLYTIVYVLIFVCLQ